MQTHPHDLNQAVFSVEITLDFYTHKTLEEIASPSQATKQEQHLYTWQMLPTNNSQTQ